MVERFLVEDRKIVDYLLVHPSKAPFFLAVGYSPNAWRQLHDDILAHPSVAPFEGFVPDEDGMKAKYRCAMPTAPNGRQYCVRTVWQQRSDGVWRFITAYPQPAQILGVNSNGT